MGQGGYIQQRRLPEEEMVLEMSAARPTRPTAHNPIAASPLACSPHGSNQKNHSTTATIQADHGYAQARYGRRASGSR